MGNRCWIFVVLILDKMIKSVKSIQKLSLLLAVFFLPNHLNFNNIFLVVFIIISVGLILLDKREKKIKALNKSIGPIIILSLPFLLNLFGLLYSQNLPLAIDYNIRAIPFFVLPIIAITNRSLFRKQFKSIGLALVLGCLASALVSWTWAINDILQSKRMFSDFIGPLYTHHRAVQFLNLHPTYLSICIYTSIGFIIRFYYTFSNSTKRFLFCVAIIIGLFMLQLLSRNALIYSILFAGGYLLLNRQWNSLLYSIILLVLLGLAVNSIKHNFLRDRLFKSLNLFEKATNFSKKDDRFDRLSASFEIFSKSPIYGHGTASEDPLRLEVFKRDKDNIAYEKNYNAHNQFFEYLSTFGLVGGICYLLFFGYLFIEVIKQNNGFLIFLVLGLFMASITESIFERSQGVVYSALLSSIVVSCFSQTNSNKHDKSSLQE